ncbi:MAG TPA: hypothetical protein DCL35_07550 [Candidatus Omnitrophica bacterium]|nr:hypothetical protein [Candidatus Omnitrophota bacterium]
MNTTRWIGLSAVAILSAASIVFLPSSFSGAVVFVFLVFFASHLFSKATILSLALYLPFQKLLVFRVEGSIPFLDLFFRRVEEGLLLVAFVTILTDKIFMKKIRAAGIELPLCALVIIALIGTIKNRLVGYDVALFDLFLLLKGFFVFYIFDILDLRHRDIRLICKVFFITAIFIFGLGLVDMAAPERFRDLIGNVPVVNYRFGIPSAQSIFVHPGGFGWFMAFFASFAIAFFAVFDKKKYLFFAILFGLGVVMSMRFKSVAGLGAVGCMVLFLTSRTRKINLIFSIGLFILLFALLFGDKAKLLFEDKVYTYFQAPAQYDVARNVLYSTGLRIAQDYFPFGAGLGAYGGWIAALYQSPLYFYYGINEVWGLDPVVGGRFLTDTFWPYIMGQFGFFGCICYAWILIAFLSRCIRTYMKCDDLLLKAFSLGSFFILIEALIESIAEPVFSTPPQYFFIFACIGITYSFISSQKDRQGQVQI